MRTVIGILLLISYSVIAQAIYERENLRYRGLGGSRGDGTAGTTLVRLGDGTGNTVAAVPDAEPQIDSIRRAANRLTNVIASRTRELRAENDQIDRLLSELETVLTALAAVVPVAAAR
eukprot:TRINITY_DN32510_c0_g1_i1.p1 TRINITY_DN32510_c0_g1~~TRINITY_DN32510_c0_g1_i1.p1  ORF type:complete len:118 (+),score=17.77 TRINITY_DN32510_c0_g1_i1:2-355(+)